MTDLQSHLLERIALRAEPELSLRQAEQQHQELFDNMPAVVYVKGVDGRYEFINRRFEELFHVSREEIIGRTDRDIFPAPMADAFHENDRTCRSSFRSTTGTERSGRWPASPPT
jgi:PAS domain S-box-containing protein